MTARFEGYGVPAAPQPRSEYTPDAAQDDVLGYVSQCEACGQRAITRLAHGADWLCPRCAEVIERSPYAAPVTPVSRELVDDYRADESCAAAREHINRELRAGSNYCPDSSLLSFGAALLDDDDLRKIQG